MPVLPTQRVANQTLGIDAGCLGGAKRKCDPGSPVGEAHNARSKTGRLTA
jgi:hypothetical protein